MLRIPWFTDSANLLLTPRGADLGLAWQVGALALFLAVPAGLVIWLYRYELQLVHRWHARGLLTARLLLLGLLWVMIALQPVLSHDAAETVVGRVCIAVDLSASMDVVDAQRPAADTELLAQALDAEPAEVARWSRKEIARRVLANPQLDLLHRLGAHHHVELVGFDETRWLAGTGGVDSLFAMTRARDAVPRATDLRQALHDTGGTGPLSGIIILTDGRHNRGADPLGVARQLGAVGVPIFPVIIGPQQPPRDLLVEDVQAPARLVKDAMLPVVARIKAVHLPPQELTVELVIDRQRVMAEHRRQIAHPGGDAAYDVRFELPMKQAGTHTIAVRARIATGGEVTQANNERGHVVQVLEERTRVLLVDEEARWEYHYVAAALQRDPSVRLDRVLLAPPRLGTVKPANAESAGLPHMRLPEAPADARLPDPLFDYDCIILGDVGPDRLPPAERKRLERHVSERAGTLVVIAGKRAMPMAYASGAGSATDPLLKMLPIREARVFAKRDGFALRLTEASKQSSFLRLDPDTTVASWPDLPKHFWSIIGTRQPGATVLAAPAEPLDEQVGLLVQQSYGFGKVVFVGIDSTWRWRQRAGDVYHHRFWGQLVRWAAADRLLPAGNHLVRFGSREPVYRAGQPIELAVRLSEQAPPLGHPEQARLRVVRRHRDTAAELVAIVPVHPSPQQGRLLGGKQPELPAGTYAVELDIAELGQTPPATFTVLPEENRELLDLSTNWELLQALATESHGRLFTPADVAQVAEVLAQKVQAWEGREDARAWQDAPLVWWTLGMLVGLLAVEWIWRKRLDLP